MGGGAGRFADLYFECTAPVAGQISNIACNSTAASLDLATIGPLTLSMGNSDQTPPDNSPGGLVNHMVRFTAVGTTVSVLFGSTNTAVSGNNAPNLAVVQSTLSTSNNNLVGAPFPIAAGSSFDWFIHPSTRFMGYITAANTTGNLVITHSSRGM